MDRLNKESSYDYAFFSPPDYDEINMNPKSDSEEYFSFVSNVLKKLNPRNIMSYFTFSYVVDGFISKPFDDEEYIEEYFGKYFFLLHFQNNL